MTTRTWIGGGNNQATNAKDWSPSGVPQPGDTLSITSGTINIFGYALAGDSLTVTAGNADLNLFNAFANIDVGLNTLGAPVASAVINLSGFDEMTYTGFASNGAINLKAGAVWEGTFNLNSSGPLRPVNGARLTINGGDSSFFVNDGSSISGDSTTINANVAGTGSFGFDLHGTLEFVHSVAAGQSVNFTQGSGVVQLDDPTQFQGLITLQPAAGAIIGPDLIELENLATADSYTYKNDMLSIYSNNHVIDTLRLNNQSVMSSGSPSPIELEKTGNVIYVFGASDTINPGGTVLPVHS